MSEFYDKNRKNIVYLLLLAAIIFFIYIFVNYLFTYIAPFFIGWLLSLIYNPFVSLLNRKLKIPRSIGTLAAIALIIAFFSSVVVGIFSQLSKEIALFYSQLPDYLNSIHEAVEDFNVYMKEYLKVLPDGLESFFETSDTNLWNIIQSFVLNNTGSNSIGFVKSIPNGFMVTLISLLSSYFFCKDKREISEFVKNHLPSPVTRGYIALRGSMGGALVGYMKSQLILMVFTFIICIIGLMLFRSPYALLLSVITSIIDALPFFGSGFILWPGAIIQLFMGNTGLAVGYIIIYLIVTLMRQVMQPKILGNQIGLHPLFTLISMYVGLKIMGVLGMIVGPILAVMIKAFYEILSKNKVFENKDWNSSD